MSSTAPEILFAQHLAANEKVHRDRALRKLQKYIFNHSSLPNGGFNESELLKIWKGLHYCMWMQDKPLIQEELSDNISNLIHSFNNAKTAMLFIKCFYMTECREWSSIDKWRVDKFLMMFRNMLTQSFEFLKKKNWSEKLVREFLDFISKYILHDDDHNTSSDGVRYHFVDTYLVELEKVSGGQLGPKQTITFIQPWIAMLPGLRSKELRTYVIKNIFGPLIQESPALTGHSRRKGSKKLRVNYRMIADKLLEAGSSEECTSVNRPAIYNLVQNFRDVADGKLPFSPEDQKEEEVPDLNDDDIESAVERLTKFKEQLRQENEAEKLKLKKRKKPEGNEDDEAYGSGAEEDQPSTSAKASTSEPSAKKKKVQPKERILSKKLQKILKAEEEYMAECCSEDEEGEDSEGSFSEQEEDLLYADDSDSSADNVEDGDEDSSEQFESITKTFKESSSRKKTAKVKEVPSKPAGGSMIKNLGKSVKAKTKAVPNSSSVKSSKIQGTSKNDITGGGDNTPTKNPTAKRVKNGQNSNRTAGDMVSNGDSDSTSKKARKKKRGKGKSKTPALEFEVEEFPETSNDLNIPELIPSTPEPMVEPEIKSKLSSKKLKRRQSLPASSNSAIVSPALVQKVTQAMSVGKTTQKFAEFVSEPLAKAKYFKKAMSNSASLAKSASNGVKTPLRSDKKRLSFGKTSSVEKMALKLRGSKAYDPTKTPEQSILKVNPIQPGTLIQVGKQATLANTLKNSKFPQRMMAMDFF